VLISYIKGLLASSWLGKLMPLINIPSKSARRGTREPELHSAKGGGGKPEKHYRDNFVTAFRRDRGEFCILRPCPAPPPPLPLDGSAARRIVDRERSFQFPRSRKQLVCKFEGEGARFERLTLPEGTKRPHPAEGSRYEWEESRRGYLMNL